MFRLFREFNLRAARRRPASLLAAIASIGVGVGVIVAVDLASAASIDAFMSAVTSIGGRVTHEVRGGPAGVPEGQISRVARLPGVSAAAAVIEAVAVLPRDPSRPLFVYGVDLLGATEFREQSDAFVPDRDAFEWLLARPGAFAAPERTARALSAKAGDVVDLVCGGRLVATELVTVIPDRVFGASTEDRLIVDIATAQEMFDRIGYVDRIDLILGDGSDEGAIAAALGPGLGLTTPERRAGANASLTASFRLNLLALSALATFVGAYLAFNAAEYAVTIRRRAIAQARCFGALRHEVLGAFLIEGACIGMLGGAVGIAIGAGLAPLALEAISATTSSLYAAIVPAPPGPNPGAVLRAFGIGVGATLLATWFPAKDAASTVPAEALSRAPDERGFRALRPRLVAVAILGALAAALMPLAPGSSPWWGYAGVAGILASAAALAPLAAEPLFKIVAATAHRAGKPLIAHAASGLLRDLSRSGASQAALAAALAMTLGVVTMVGSFRDTVTVWLDQILEADVYVGPLRPAAPFDVVALPEDLIDALRSRKEILSVDVLRGGPATLADGARIFLAGVDARAAPGRWWYLGGARADAVRDALQAGGCVVSESFARRRDVGPGDVIALPGRAGPAKFAVAAVFRDYSVDAGYVAVDHERYIEAFGNVAPRGAAIRLREGIAAADAARAIQSEIGARYPIRARANAELKQDALATFERTFAVTTFLRGVAVSMAFLGVAVALFARAIARRRETATLRAIGLTKRNAVLLAAIQGSLFVIPPALLGALGGMGVAYILTDVVNVRAFGWSLMHSFPGGATAIVIGSVVVMGSLAAIVPLRKTLRVPPAVALREE